MIDFILVAKIDDERRMELLMQTMKTLEDTVPAELCHRFIFVDDCSKLPLPYGFPSTKFNSVVEKNVTQRGVGGSKNRGVELHTELGRGEMLYLFDADVYFTPGWLEKLLDAYEANKEKFKLLAGGIHPFLQPRAGEGNALVTSHDAISGWSWLLTYETWDEYGKLADNSLGTGKSEDWEYCQRIRNDGFLVGCITPQVVAHCGMTNTEGELIGGMAESGYLALKVAPDAVLI